MSPLTEKSVIILPINDDDDDDDFSLLQKKRQNMYLKLSKGIRCRTFFGREITLGRVLSIVP